MEKRVRAVSVIGLWLMAGQLADSALGNPFLNVKTVFLILMENHNWSAIQGSTSAPYINGTLLPMASYCLRYYNPPGIHPSEPNYIWLEAGTNFGIFNDNSPIYNQQTTTNHLISLLRNAGITWKAYQENISGLSCPMTDNYPYAVKHSPFMFFTDVTGDAAYCSNHVRPYPELELDLVANTIARYNFITPNLTNDMHDAGCTGCSSVANGDRWLASEIPKIMNSAAYLNNGAIFITWDEGGERSDGPIGMIVLSPLAKGNGYISTTRYDHSSTLRTMQTIFGVGPFLGAAANADDLSELFVDFQLTGPQLSANGFQFTITGTVPGQTNVVEGSSDLKGWTGLNTNVTTTNWFVFSDTSSGTNRFYRVRLMP